MMSEFGGDTTKGLERDGCETEIVHEGEGCVLACYTSLNGDTVGIDELSPYLYEGCNKVYVHLLLDNGKVRLLDIFVPNLSGCGLDGHSITAPLSDEFRQRSQYAYASALKHHEAIQYLSFDEIQF
ncbi:MAG: hypothetical protein QY318_00585 [Candidatus Dojkabacteria bacterium]|nr:MAG: hypothetical protein QY318_00585 [Candidatus Dojkabacteria bacterium]